MTHNISLKVWVIWFMPPTICKNQNQVQKVLKFCLKFAFNSPNCKKERIKISRSGREKI